MFTLSIKMGNDAMQTASDIAHALRQVATSVSRGSESGPVWDDNGNRVGSFNMNGDPDADNA